MRLNPGDFVVLHTDGVTDALNADEQEFGLERLRHAVFVNRRRSAAELVAALEGTLREFTGPTAPFDDITLVAAKRL